MKKLQIKAKNNFESFFLKNKQYLPLSKYVNANTKVKILHKKCGIKFDVIPRDFIRRKGTCVNMDCILIKKRKNNFKKYGVDETAQLQSVRNLAKETCIKRYGVEFPCQSEKIKERMEKTNLKRYGFKNPLKSPIIREKIKKTLFNNYGVYNVGESCVIRDRIKKTCVERYGVANPSLNLDIIKKIRLKYLETIKNRYGQTSPNYNPIACKFFDKLNKKYKLAGLHAENGGEFYIKELGYWLDFYSPKYNLVIEWDERHHKFQKKKDLMRQKEIENFLKCNFYRIDECNFNFKTIDNQIKNIIMEG